MKKMEWKIMVKIVATTSLPVDRLKATDCNAAARAKILYSEGQCLVNDLFSLVGAPLKM